MNQIQNIEEDFDDLRNQLRDLFLLETKHEGDVEDIPMFSIVDEFVYTLIKNLHHQLQKAREEERERIITLIKSEYDGFCDDQILDEFLECLLTAITKTDN